MLEFNEKSTLVSVVIPFYNVEKYFDRCLKSVVTQTYNNLEIILVNNNSTDKSVLIAKEYRKSDKRIKIIHQKIQSIVMSRRVGVDISRGKYVMSIDADDYIEKNTIEKLLNIAIENNCDCVQCSFDVKGLKNKNRIFPNYKIYSKDSGKHILKKWLKGDPYFGSQIVNKLFESSLLKKIYKKIEIDRSLGEDVILFLTYIKYNIKICSVSEVLYHYTYRKKSISHNLNIRANLVNEFQFINDAYQLMIKHYSKTVPVSLMNEWYINMIKQYLENYDYKQRQNGILIKEQ